MIIGIPKEIKNNEFRVAITPAGVHEFVTRGHLVVVERGAGLGSGIPDEDYVAAGAEIVADADDVWAARRHGAEGQGTGRGRVPPAAARTRSSSPTCTWPPPGMHRAP